MDSQNLKAKTDIGKLYESYRQSVKLYFLKYTSSTEILEPEERAEDLTQDLFIKLIGYQEMVVEETAHSFIFTIARRMVIDEARHRQFVLRATEGYRQEQERYWQEAETLECKQIREMERQKLRTLPRRMAEVYELTRFGERSSQEIAEQMGISKRTVEYHLLVSRREIRQSLRRALAM